MRELNILPAEGIITVDELAKFMRLSENALINNLTKNNIPVLRLSKFRRNWVVQLGDLRALKPVPPATPTHTETEG